LVTITSEVENGFFATEYKIKREKGRGQDFTR